MGVYINREMPKSCRDCFVNINTAAFPACPLAENYASGKSLVADGLGYDIRPGDCPLIEIPPHGDLIDKDETMNAILEERGEDTACWFAGIVNDMPTIIEADGYSKQNNHRAEIEMQIAKEEVHD